MKYLVLNSGGYDSAVVIALLHSLGHEMELIHFDYGQKSAAIEWRNAISLAKSYGKSCYFKQVSLDFDKERYYVPARNLIFLSMAAGIAEKEGFDGIAVGFHKCDIYLSDNSPEFIEKFDSLLEPMELSLWTPLINANKRQVFELGIKLGVKREETWSCNFPTAGGEACGKCRDCEFFEENKDLFV